MAPQEYKRHKGAAEQPFRYKLTFQGEVDGNHACTWTLLFDEFPRETKRGLMNKAVPFHYEFTPSEIHFSRDEDFTCVESARGPIKIWRDRTVQIQTTTPLSLWALEEREFAQEALVCIDYYNYMHYDDDDDVEGEGVEEEESVIRPIWIYHPDGQLLLFDGQAGLVSAWFD